MPRALILCTGNSCRSQMAEAWWRHLGQGTWEVASAGSRPAGYVHPLAVQVMHEAGLDIAAQQSKALEIYRGQAFDVVVTVCDNAREGCPVWPGSRALHWPFDDPPHCGETAAEQLAAFRRVRDEIRDRIAAYLTQPRT